MPWPSIWTAFLSSVLTSPAAMTAQAISVAVMGCSAVLSTSSALLYRVPRLNQRFAARRYHGYAVQVVGGDQHLNDGFDVHHLLAQAFGLLPVVHYLSA